jgi:putative transposase
MLPSSGAGQGQGSLSALDGLHKLTTRLAKTYGTVVVEDLAVTAMTASAKGSGHWRGKAGLNRSVLGASPAELRRQLSYKCTWYGSKLVVANRWYPSSKTCSRCGLVKTKLGRPRKGTTGTASGAGTGRAQPRRTRRERRSSCHLAGAPR